MGAWERGSVIKFVVRERQDPTAPTPGTMATPDAIASPCGSIDHQTPIAKGTKKKVMQRYDNHELQEVSLDVKDAGQPPPDLDQIGIQGLGTVVFWPRPLVRKDVQGARNISEGRRQYSGVPRGRGRGGERGRGGKRGRGGGRGPEREEQQQQGGEKRLQQGPEQPPRGDGKRVTTRNPKYMNDDYT